jgi:hypothetical protein
MTATGIVRSLWSCLCTSVSLAVDGAGHGAAYKPGAAALAASAAPGSACSCRTYACSIRLAPRSLRGEVPGDPTGPACRTARRRWLGPGRRGLLPRWSWIPGPLHATRARSRQMVCSAGPQPLVLVSRHRVRKGRRTLAALRLRRQAPPLPACTAARLTEPLRSASTAGGSPKAAHSQVSAETGAARASRLARYRPQQFGPEARAGPRIFIRHPVCR